MQTNTCYFTQCIRCDQHWHLCNDFEGDLEDTLNLEVDINLYCLYCGHCQICGCCGDCGKPECQEEHI